MLGFSFGVDMAPAAMLMVSLEGDSFAHEFSLPISSSKNLGRLEAGAMS